MGNLSFLITDLMILSLQITCAVCNGFALFIYFRIKLQAKPVVSIYEIFRVKRLRKNLSLRMVLYLSITDTLLAVTALPYIIYLIALWNDYNIILNPHMVMISSTPLVIQLKINLTLTIAIALDRTIALYFTVIYRRLSSELYANLSLLTGLTLACCDVAAEFILSPILPRPNCAAIGCFVSNRFRYYWGTSNMVLGLLVIILTITMLVKLRYIQKNSDSEKALVTTSNSNTSRFRQANRSSVGILLTSLLFVTVPSVGVGFVEMLGFSIFKTVGPFYILGLLSAGTCNCIVYFALNRDMRVLARNCILGKPDAGPEATTKASKMTPFAVPL